MTDAHSYAQTHAHTHAHTHTQPGAQKNISTFRATFLFSYALLALTIVAILLAGCGAGFAPASVADTPSAMPIGSIWGSAYGGQQPIVGARVFLFAASTTAYAGAATSLLGATSANPSFPTARDTTSTSPTYNDYYITTDSTGTFNLSGSYTCTAGTQVYLYTVGGNPGAGTNSAAGLLAVLGQCPSSGSLAAAVPFLYVSELSTVAAAYALAGFATDATHVGSANTTLAKTGIANAFLTAGNLYSNATHLAAPTTTPAGNGTVPQALLHTIANSAAACINSSGPATAPCAAFLAYTKSAGATGTAASDTATALINLAHNPYPTAAGITAIFNNASTTPPFAPTLSAAPADFTVSLSFTGSLNKPQAPCVDAAGNIWVVNNGSNSLAKFNTLGAPASGSPFTGGGLSTPSFCAIDSSGNVWVSNGNNSLSEFANAGTAVSTALGYIGGGLNAPGAIAIDSSNNVWVANSASISKFSNIGVAISTPLGYLSTNGVTPIGIAIDSANNVWISSPNTSSVVEASNAGAYTATTTGYGISNPVGIALDSSNNFWTANYGNNTASHKPLATAESGGGLSTPYDLVLDGANNAWISNGGAAGISAFTSGGTAISPAARFQSAYLSSAAVYLAIDGSGNVWVPANGGTTMVEFVGLAVPVVRPISPAGLGVKP